MQGNVIEVEVLLGEVVGEAGFAGVDVPTLRCLYHLCKGIQQHILEGRQVLTHV